MISGCTSFSVAMLLVLLSTPTWATAMPTDEETMLIEPKYPFHDSKSHRYIYYMYLNRPYWTVPVYFRVYLSLLIAVLFGIGDNCVNTSRTVVCTLILTDKRAQVFAISKFHQVYHLTHFLFITRKLIVSHGGNHHVHVSLHLSSRLFCTDVGLRKRHRYVACAFELKLWFSDSLSTSY